MSIEGQGHFFTIYFPGFVCFVLYWAKIPGERLQDHWSSGFVCLRGFIIFFLVFFFKQTKAIELLSSGNQSHICITCQR